MNPSNKPALQSDGKNGKEILDYFLKISPECNRFYGWDAKSLNSPPIGIYVFINERGDLDVTDYFPDGYELITLDSEGRIYPCCKCGLLRNEAEGGKIFTVCDNCWDENNKVLDSKQPSEVEILRQDNKRLRECLKELVSCTRQSGNGRNRLNDNKLGKFHIAIEQAKQLIK